MSMSRCGQWRTCRGGLCEKRPRTPLCQRQLPPAPKWSHNRTQLGQSATLVGPLGKQLRKDKKSAQQLRGVRKMWQKQCCRHQGQWRKRGGGDPGSRADFLVAHGEDSAGCLPGAHRRPLWSRWMYPERSSSLWRIHTRDLCSLWRGARSGAGFWQDLGLWGTCVGKVCSLRSVSHEKDAHWSSSWRATAQGRGTHPGEVNEGLHPLRGTPTLQQGKSMRGKEQQRGSVMGWP